ncbi:MULTISPECIES: hypothetical protein [Streptomyces]|uniref:Uncharacterized protein n=1 Tax=Streptomyces yunnanensis TaxID=156453 RepID=A0A9X8QML4_9ACTN|nr:hypothetical protein [Streptomyces yunnanensis]SHK76858.1 hypothetical protein SAMN05216268_101255 [Streptomyces yunnanensis]
MTADEHKYEKRAAEIVALYKEGLAVKRLLDRFEISTWALYDLLRRHQVPLRGANSASRRAATEYERLRSDGLMHHEIAEKFGIKPNTLYRTVLRLRSAARR